MDTTTSSHCGVNLKDRINTNDDNGTMAGTFIRRAIVDLRIEKYMGWDPAAQRPAA